MLLSKRFHGFESQLDLINYSFHSNSEWLSVEHNVVQSGETREKEINFEKVQFKFKSKLSFQVRTFDKSNEVVAIL